MKILKVYLIVFVIFIFQKKKFNAINSEEICSSELNQIDTIWKLGNHLVLKHGPSSEFNYQSYQNKDLDRNDLDEKIFSPKINKEQKLSLYNLNDGQWNSDGISLHSLFPFNSIAAIKSMKLLTINTINLCKMFVEEERMNEARSDRKRRQLDNFLLELRENQRWNRNDFDSLIKTPTLVERKRLFEAFRLENEKIIKENRFRKNFEKFTNICNDQFVIATFCNKQKTFENELCNDFPFGSNQNEYERCYPKTFVFKYLLGNSNKFHLIPFERESWVNFLQLRGFSQLFRGNFFLVFPKIQCNSDSFASKRAKKLTEVKFRSAFHIKSFDFIQTQSGYLSDFDGKKISIAEFLNCFNNSTVLHHFSSNRLGDIITDKGGPNPIHKKSDKSNKINIHDDFEDRDIEIDARTNAAKVSEKNFDISFDSYNNFDDVDQPEDLFISNNKKSIIRNRIDDRKKFNENRKKFNPYQYQNQKKEIDEKSEKTVASISSLIVSNDLNNHHSDSIDSISIPTVSNEEKFSIRIPRKSFVNSIEESRDEELKSMLEKEHGRNRFEALGEIQDDDDIILRHHHQYSSDYESNPNNWKWFILIILIAIIGYGCYRKRNWYGRRLERRKMNLIEMIIFLQNDFIPTKSDGCEFISFQNDEINSLIVIEKDAIDSAIMFDMDLIKQIGSLMEESQYITKMMDVPQNFLDQNKKEEKNSKIEENISNKVLISLENDPLENQLENQLDSQKILTNIDQNLSIDENSKLLRILFFLRTNLRRINQARFRSIGIEILDQ
ncbi:hypothetical protein SSS_01010 [Sarcoptes scabiei]|uniref:Uncharacterized protein n=1 Tax=Sarcoptes scabiei TaxID=52283 RepID=A0A834RFW6_SARSC|nr:hypothetical protein SSS_01010 [Sarcoptes scabiei]